MNFENNEQQKMLQKSVYEAASKMDASMSFADKWKYLASTGLIGTCIDAEYGGSGLKAPDMLHVLESLARGSSDNGLSFSIAAHTLSCVIPIQKFGTADQKKKFLPGLIHGDIIAANAMTESESGSDAFNMQCKAIKKNDNYILNGTKTFISNSNDCKLVLAYASTDHQKGFFGGVTAFIAEKEKFSAEKPFKKMGLESCSLGEIFFNDAAFTNDEILGKEGGGAFIFNYSMEWERICMTGIHIGAMQRILEKTIEFSKQRKSLGQSISKFQGVSHIIAEMKVLVDVSRAYAYHAASLLDNKKNISSVASIAKLFVSNSVRTFMLNSMQVFGGYGYLSDYGIEQEVRDALAANIYSGTNEIQKNIIASNLGI